MAVKEKIGVVVSDKMKDTRIVAVNDRIIHKRYKKSTRLPIQKFIKHA